MCRLNIEKALFPAGDPDTFSPAAFKNLQLNAVGVLGKMQTAYRQRVASFKEMEAELAARQDEFEEADTRAQHLKMQLEGMATRAAEQEKAMQQLQEQLFAERQVRAEERANRQKRIIITPADAAAVSEDLEVDNDQLRRKWRKSCGTVKSDVSYDTDDESATSESVFSRSRSPTMPAAAFDFGASASKPKNSLVSPTLKSTSHAGYKGHDDDPVYGCQNCMGQDASAAWDTVGLLRDENRHLKQRVAELDVAVEAALDLVNGLGIFEAGVSR
jgi:hypothetical protein